MKIAKDYFFFKDVKPFVLVDMDLSDDTLKSFSFRKESKEIKISASFLDNTFSLVYACFEKGDYVCDDAGVIPAKQIYSTITAIVNDYMD